MAGNRVESSLKSAASCNTMGLKDVAGTALLKVSVSNQADSVEIQRCRHIKQEPSEGGELIGME